MTGCLYGLGVGPGDPELITIKAIRILNMADVVIAPETTTGKGSIALDIIEKHVADKNKVRFQTYPMTYDKEQLDSSWKANVKEIIGILNEGKNVAFVTLGDPMVYSTYIYIMRLIKREGLKVETVPGITSFCAAASRLNLPLAEGNETIAIIPAAYECSNLDKILTSFDNVVLMKPSKGFPKLLKKLDRHDLTNKTIMIEKCGHKDEKIINDLNKLNNEKIHYLSMLITKKRGEAE